MTDLARTAVRTVGGLVGAGVAGVAYAALVERTWFTLRRFAVPALPPGSAPVRILTVSDLHLEMVAWLIHRALPPRLQAPVALLLEQLKLVMAQRPQLRGTV